MSMEQKISTLISVLKPSSKVALIEKRGSTPYYDDEREKLSICKEITSDKRWIVTPHRYGLAIRNFSIAIRGDFVQFSFKDHLGNLYKIDVDHQTADRIIDDFLEILGRLDKKYKLTFHSFFVDFLEVLKNLHGFPVLNEEFENKIYGFHNAVLGINGVIQEIKEKSIEKKENPSLSEQILKEMDVLKIKLKAFQDQKKDYAMV